MLFRSYIVQSDEVLLAIRVLMGVMIVALIAVSLFSSFKFRVNNKKLERMRYFIDINREGRLEEITEEEKAERDALIKELYGNKAVTRIYTKEEADAIKRAEEEALGDLDKNDDTDIISDEATAEEAPVAETTVEE